MKRRVLLFLLAALPVIVNAQEPAKPQDAAPSLDETTHWLQEKITNYASYSKGMTYYEKDGRRSVPVAMTLIHKVTASSFDGCTFTFSYLWTETPIIAHSEASIIQMGDIDSSKVSLKETNEAPYFVSLNTFGYEMKIKKEKTTIVGARSTIPAGTANASVVVIPFEDKALAERVVKAFAHLADLCKKKKEPF